MAAALARDEALIADFNAGLDIHTKTAADVFGVKMEEVTKEQRRAAKVINFGVLYGMSPRGLAEATGMEFAEAKKFIDDYFEVRKPIRGYLDKVLKQAKERGYVETYYGRRRLTPDVRAGNFTVRAAAERAAMNMPIQGTEADLVKRAMLTLDQRFQRWKSFAGDSSVLGGALLVRRMPNTTHSVTPPALDNPPAKDLSEEFSRDLLGGQTSNYDVGMVLQVHDSVMVECDAEIAEEVSAVLKEVMENVAPELPVKLVVDVKISDWWE